MTVEEFRKQLLAFVGERKKAVIEARNEYDKQDKYSKGLIAGLELAENLIRGFQMKF